MKEADRTIAEELARAEGCLSRAETDLAIARAACQRLEKELRVADIRLAESEAARSAAEARLAEREKYISELHASRGWLLLQGLRGLLGRRW